jgi:hypothetical protein
VSIDRRTFIMMTTAVVAGSALASFPTGLPGLLSSQLTASNTDLGCIEFKISGWNQLGDIADHPSETSSSGSAPENLNGDPVFIRINQFWRTAWR